MCEVLQWFLNSQEAHKSAWKGKLDSCTQRRRSFANSDPQCFITYVSNLLVIHQPSLGTQSFIQERNLTTFLTKVVFYYFRQFEYTKDLLQGRHLSVVHCVIILQGFLWTCYSLKSSYRRQTFQVSLLKHVFNYKNWHNQHTEDCRLSYNNIIIKTYTGDRNLLLSSPKVLFSNKVLKTKSREVLL